MNTDRKKNITTILAAVLTVFALVLVGTAIYRHYNPETIEIPVIENTYSVPMDDPAVRQDTTIPGANSGNSQGTGDQSSPDGTTTAPQDGQGSQDGQDGDVNNNENGEVAQQPVPQTPQDLGFELAEGYTVSGTDPNTGAPQVSGPDVQIPGIGDFDAGERGDLTTDTPSTPRQSGGDPISRELADKCEGIANGSICVPSIGEVIYYHSVGTRQSTTGSGLIMAVPSTDTAGWLNDSAPIGASEGTSVLAAHVIFRGGVEGPFYDLNQLNAGDEVIVRDMDGKNFAYRIYKTTLTEGKTLPDEVYEYTDSPHQLALVTCAGDFVDGRYGKRLVVWAAPVAS